MKRKSERNITRVVVATGVSSVVTQLLLIREFLSQFQGNEFVIALILFNWLILGGAGTYIARWITKHFFKPTLNRLGWLSLILASLPSAQILAIRHFRDVFFIHGSSVGFYPTFIFTILTIAPYALLIGFVLPFSLFVIRTENPDYPGSRIYITDNIGDVSGGALFSFALVYLATPLQAALIANIPFIIAIYLLYSPSSRYNPFVLLGIGLALTILFAGVILELSSITPPEGDLVHYKESRYGRIMVYQDQEQFTLFVSGTPQFGSQNLIIAEETIHYPLAQLNQTQHVLLISAESGMLTELQKYQPKSVDYLELDPQVASVQFKFDLLKKIPSLHVIHQDGRAYLTNSKKIYDAIIVNLSEPNTFQINRFFTDRFFALARQHLAQHGVLSFSMQGFDNYLSEPQRQKISSLFNTAKDYFENVLMLPGQKIFFLCRSLPIVTDIPRRLAQKNIQTRYIKGYFYGNLTDERITRLNTLVDTDAPKNRDDFPQLMRIMFQQWFAKFSTSPAGFTAVLVVLCLIYLVRMTAEEFVLFSTGFMVMGSEVLIIFAFQIIFGYIYLQIGLIITVFLAGLMPGAWLGEKLKSRGRQTLAFTDALFIILMVLLIFALTKGGDLLPVAFFLIFGFIISLICGFQFPVALKLRGDNAPAITRIFSADLIGAACGTLVTNVALIPYLGIVWTAGGLIGLKVLSLIIIRMRVDK